jgi:DNA-binding ferritin-like protein
MLNLWENPFYSIEERLKFAQAEIQRYQNNIKKIYDDLESAKKHLNRHIPYADDTTIEWMEERIHILEKVIHILKTL